MAEERTVPRHKPEEPCAVCDGKKWVKRPVGKDGDTVTVNCPACVPPGASNR